MSQVTRITATAGAGKTTKVLSLVDELVNQGVDPDSIWLISFTKKSVMDLRERTYGRYSNIFTFHSLCRRLLTAIDSNFKLLDEYAARGIVRNILPDDTVDAGVIQSRLSYLVNTMSKPTDAEVILLEEYQKQKQFQNALDFDDLLVKANEYFEQQHPVMLDFASKCMHLFVDEFQDTNGLQFRFIKYITDLNPQCHLTVVGDTNQAIYAFRGADHKNLDTLDTYYAQINNEILYKNYRSYGNIITVANTLMSTNNQPMVEMVTDKGAGADVELVRDIDSIHVAKYIVTRIKNAIAAGIEPKDIAILGRTNADLDYVEEQCRLQKVPFSVNSDFELLNRKEIQDYIALFYLFSSAPDEFQIKRGLMLCPSIGSATVEKILKDMEAFQCKVIDSINANRIGLNTKQRKQLADFMNLTYERGNVKDYAYTVLTHTEYDKALINEDKKKLTSRYESVCDFITAFVDYSETYEIDDDIDLADIIFKYQDADVFGTFNLFLHQISTDELDVENKNKVQLVTVHKSKGLEWDNVFIVSVDDMSFPHNLSRSDEEIRDELKLLYVACTRARNKLVMCLPMLQQKYGKTIPANLSRFINNQVLAVMSESNRF